MNDQPRHLFVDAVIFVPDARDTVVATFGPFSDRSEVERALIAFIGRENAKSAVIRDPDA